MLDAMMQYLLDNAGGIVTLLGALFALVGWSWRSVARPLGDIKETIDRELKTNGGSSLKDAVNRLDATVAQHTTSILHIERRVMLAGKKQDVFLEHLQAGYVDVQVDVLPDGSIRAFNKSVNRIFARMLGVTKEDLSGEGWLRCMTEEQIAEYGPKWERLFRHNLDGEFAMEMTHADGHTVPIYLHAIPVKKELDSDTESRRYMMTVQEILEATEADPHERPPE